MKNRSLLSSRLNENKPRKVVHWFNLFIIPAVAIFCFYFVTKQVSNSFMGSTERARNETEKVQLDVQMQSAPVEYENLNLRDRQVAVEYLQLAPSSSAILTPASNETYQKISQSRINLVYESPVSTFSIDVDTGGYSNIRRLLRAGSLPNKDQVRVEEIINYLSYDYPVPESIDKPFTISTQIKPTPWNQNTQLLTIGLRGYEEDREDLPKSNLVFLVDVSGSMQDMNKLPLVKQSLKLLTNSLSEKDRVSIVTYAGQTVVALPSTSGHLKNEIKRVIDNLHAHGSTAGESALKLAYAEARAGFIPGGNNRIVMMTDGDFNVGLSSVEAMVSLVEEKRKSGVFLSTVGFGQGNFREDMMERMADHGNGSYSYIDSYQEAMRVFELNMKSSLFTIAKDVKVQVEFNPAMVKEYRLIGYENRELEREDFNNDKVDAGDVGQGHRVTAIYEITLKGKPGSVDELRFQKVDTEEGKINQFVKQELAFVKLRYKPVDLDRSRLLTKSVQLAKESVTGKKESMFNTAIAAAAFGEVLRESKYLDGSFDYKSVIRLLENTNSNYPEEVGELREMVKMASSLSRN